MKMTKQIRSKRTRTYVDADVQGGLLRKISWQWMMLVSVTCMMMAIWVWLFEHPDATAAELMSLTFGRCLPFLAASASLVPVFLLDTVRLSNRFAGPTLRFRAALSDAARGRSVQPLTFRHDDFWQEMADDLNGLLHRPEQRSPLACSQAQGLLAESASMPAPHRVDPQMLEATVP